MHLALQITGYSALMFFVLSAALGYADSRDHGPDSGGAALPMVLCGALTALFGAAWLVLVLVKAASA